MEWALNCSANLVRLLSPLAGPKPGALGSSLRDSTSFSCCAPLVGFLAVVVKPGFYLFILSEFPKLSLYERDDIALRNLLLLPGGVYG